MWNMQELQKCWIENMENCRRVKYEMCKIIQMVDVKYMKSVRCEICKMILVMDEMQFLPGSGHIDTAIWMH